MPLASCLIMAGGLNDNDGADVVEITEAYRKAEIAHLPGERRVTFGSDPAPEVRAFNQA